MSDQEKIERIAEWRGWQWDKSCMWWTNGSTIMAWRDKLWPAGAVDAWNAEPGLWVTVMARCTRGDDFCTAVRDTAAALL